MVIKKKILATFVLTLSVVFFWGTADVAAASKTVAEVMKEPYRINWMPNVQYSRLVLSVSKPNGEIIRKTFEADGAPYFDLSGTFGQKFPDGSYTYELRLIPVVDKNIPGSHQRVLTQTGYFMIRGGTIVTGAAPEETPDRTLCDCYEIEDDLIVDGICVGNDCQNNADCYDETLKLKEEVIRVLFEDTSSGECVPTNDWQIIINDSASGGGEYFAIQDADAYGATTPFTIENEAPNNSLYIKSNGRIGIGTSAPTHAMEMKTPYGTPATFICDQTDGASVCLCADNVHTFVGSKTNHDLRLLVNDSPKITIDTDGEVGIGTKFPSHLLEVYNASASNAYCDGGDWVNGSSRAYKENIHDLTTDEAVAALEGLNPVKFNYKFDKEEEKLGFIAEDVPGLVAQNDRKGMSPMDVVAVLTKVVQQQQKTISELKEEVAELKKKLK